MNFKISQKKSMNLGMKEGTIIAIAKGLMGGICECACVVGICAYMWLLSGLFGIVAWGCWIEDDDCGGWIPEW